MVQTDASCIGITALLLCKCGTAHVSVLKLELKPAREEDLYISIQVLCSRSFLWGPAAPANLLHVTLQRRGRSCGPSTAVSHIV